MSAQLFLNNFDTQFIASVKAAPTTGTPATELDYGIVRVSQAAGAILGTLTNGDYYTLTAFKRSGSNESSVEVMKVTNVDTSVINETRLTVLRGQEGTTPESYVAGDYVSLRFTAASASGMLQKSGNLAGLADTSVARTNLGLGSSATLSAPASGNAADGEVVKGNDTRLSDARTPTAHSHIAAPVHLTTNATLSSNAKYSYSANLVLTLPPNPANGDVIPIYNTGTVLTTVVGRNGKTIMGLAQDMTLDIADKKFVFEYLSASGDWRLGA
jgi:hypothetical protein